MALGMIGIGIVAVIGVPLVLMAYSFGTETLISRFPDVTSERMRPWIWLAPALILIVVFYLYPTIRTLLFSFQNADSTAFIGLANYVSIFTDPDMLSTIGNNVLWLVLFVMGTVMFGILIAILADRVSYENVIKSLIFLPMAISFVAAGVIWRFMYEYQPLGFEQTGTVNAIISALTGDDFEPIPFLQNRSINNIALIIVGIWMWTGFCMVIFSAALKSIPNDWLEAARIDGATEWNVLWYLILPSMRTTIVVVATTMTINVLKIFDIVYTMTNGNSDTNVIALRMYHEMFQFNHSGRASAIAVLLLVLVIPIMVFNIRNFQAER